jgi:Flp pilus assembly pilin Flp
MYKRLHNFWTDDRAQDLIEYTLLIALVALAAAAIFATSTQNMGGIWQRNGGALNSASAISSAGS